MKTFARSWAGLVLFAIVGSCVIALLIAFLGAAAAAANHDSEVPYSTTVPQAPASQAASAVQTYDGMITDTRCGAKHRPGINMTATDCTRACVHAGAQFALVEGDTSYVLTGDLQQLKQAAGTRVEITGVRKGNTIEVASIGPEI